MVMASQMVGREDMPVRTARLRGRGRKGLLNLGLDAGDLANFDRLRQDDLIEGSRPRSARSGLFFLRF